MTITEMSTELMSFIRIIIVPMGNIFIETGISHR